MKWLTPLLQPGGLLLFDELLGEDPAEARALAEWSEETGVRLALLGLFGHYPSGHGGMTDRRGLFQVVGEQPVRNPRRCFRCACGASSPRSGE